MAVVLLCPALCAAVPAPPPDEAAPLSAPDQGGPCSVDSCFCSGSLVLPAGTPTLPAGSDPNWLAGGPADLDAACVVASGAGAGRISSRDPPADGRVLPLLI